MFVVRSSIVLTDDDCCPPGNAIQLISGKQAAKPLRAGCNKTFLITNRLLLRHETQQKDTPKRVEDSERHFILGRKV